MFSALNSTPIFYDLSLLRERGFPSTSNWNLAFSQGQGIHAIPKANKKPRLPGWIRSGHARLLLFDFTPDTTERNDVDADNDYENIMSLRRGRPNEDSRIQRMKNDIKE